MFELKGVGKKFGETWAVRGVSAQFHEGHTHALIGPSGCGKSTTLRLLNGLIWPDKGEVVFDGQPLSQANARQVRLAVGYVIQEGGLFPHMTRRQNVTLMAERLGWSKERIASRVHQLRALVQLPEELLERLPRHLSGGQRQRISLMRALMLDPKALLLDEPLGALDPMIRSELQQQLRDLFDDLDKTVIVVTHDMAEAAFLSEDILLMHNGEIVQRGSVETLREEPAREFVREFLDAQRGWQ